MSFGVGAIDAVSGFPDHDDRDEETHQADSVEGGHEVLALFAITFEDDEEDHHDGENSSGSTDNSKISDKSPNTIKFSQQEGSLVVLVKSKGVT